MTTMKISKIYTKAERAEIERKNHAQAKQNSLDTHPAANGFPMMPQARIRMACSA